MHTAHIYNIYFNLWIWCDSYNGLAEVACKSLHNLCQCVFWHTFEYVSMWIWVHLWFDWLLPSALMCDSSIKCVFLLFSCNVIQGVVYSLPSRRKSFLKCSTRWRTSLGSLTDSRDTEGLVIRLQFCIEFIWVHSMQFSPNRSLMNSFYTNTPERFFSGSFSWCMFFDVSLQVLSYQLEYNPLFYYTFTTIMTHCPFLMNRWACYEWWSINIWAGLSCNRL